MIEKKTGAVLIFKLNKNNSYAENNLFKLLTTSVWIEECINKKFKIYRF